MANQYGVKRQPFFFLIDFELKKPFICKLEEVAKLNIFYKVNFKSNFPGRITNNKSLKLKVYPYSKPGYEDSFQFVKSNIMQGNSYLLNLTFPNKIEINTPFPDIFQCSKAPYKLFFKNKFILFSPECFIKINKNRIYSYPMKGTIDRSIPNAEKLILENEKELWEHNTIIDLIRNDLSMVSQNVEVTKYRYLDYIKTNNKDLIQVSSEIRGDLDKDWNEKLGNIIWKLLPAGSVSGAPKQKTLEIIRNAERNDRGYYSGIFGIYDGTHLDSAVNIRYIENSKNGLHFRSGGGITALSDPDYEYQEMLNKIYVPIA